MVKINRKQLESLLRPIGIYIDFHAEGGKRWLHLHKIGTDIGIYLKMGNAYRSGWSKVKYLVQDVLAADSFNEYIDDEYTDDSVSKTFMKNIFLGSRSLEEMKIRRDLFIDKND